MKNTKTSTCRLRKAQCPDCGYVIRVTRSWMLQGLPVCPCGGRLEPVETSDKAYCGLVTSTDMSAREWNAVCRENGWLSQMVGQHGTMIRMERAGSLTAKRKGLPTPLCAFPGCGLMVAGDADYCAHGHAQHDHVEPLEVIPF